MSTIGRPRMYGLDVGKQTNAEKQRAYRARVAARLEELRRLKQRKAYLSSQTTEWETPQWFFDHLDAEFHFTLDPCATPENAKCARYFTRREDGLAQSWGSEICFMNPPYGHGVERWIRKAYESAQAGATVVCLVKSTTDTQWYHRYAKPYAEIRPVEGRLTFGGAPHRAPFPSMVVIFRREA